MFPITEEYIEREYRIAGNHMVLVSEHVIKEVEQKARKVIELLKCGVSFTPTQADVIKMLDKLKCSNDESDVRKEHHTQEN